VIDTLSTFLFVNSICAVMIERFPDRFSAIGPLNLISVRRLAA